MFEATALRSEQVRRLWQLLVEVHHRQGELDAMSTPEALAQLPAGIASGADEHPAVKVRDMSLQPEGAGPGVGLEVLDQSRGEVDLLERRLVQIDQHEVHAGKVAPLAHPTGVPGDPEDAEFPLLHVPDAVGDPVRRDHEEIGVDHQQVSRRHEREGQAQSGGMVVTSPSALRQGRSVHAGEHRASGVVQGQVGARARGVVDDEETALCARIERIDQRQLAADVVVMLLQPDRDDRQLRREIVAWRARRVAGCLAIADQVTLRRWPFCDLADS